VRLSSCSLIEDQLEREIKSLTSLRGLASIWVVLFHLVDTIDKIAGREHVAGLFDKGYLAVDFFFILSGFILSKKYASLFMRKIDKQEYYSFLLKRVARIYPLYIAVIIFLIFYTLIVAGSFVGTAPPPAIISHNFAIILATNILMIQAWGIAYSLVVPAWSISTEWAAYLVFPALTKLWSASSPSRVCLGAVCLLALLYVLTLLGPTGNLNLSYERSPFPLFRCFAGFSLGMLVARWTDIAASSLPALRDSHWAAAAAVVILLYIFFPINDAELVVAFPMLVLACVADRGWWCRALSWWPFYWLGEISYSIYLVHRPLLEVVEPLSSLVKNWVPAPVVAPLTEGVALLLVVGVAQVTYSVIERPGRRALQRLSLRQTSPAAV